MSNTHYILIHPHKLPSGVQLQAVLNTLATDVGALMTIESAWNAAPGLHSVHCTIPAQRRSIASGSVDSAAQINQLHARFELFSEPLEHMFEDAHSQAVVTQLAAGRAHVLSLTWHHNTSDMCCVMLVSAALVHSFDAVVSFEGQPAYTFDQLMTQTRALLQKTF